MAVAWLPVFCERYELKQAQMNMSTPILGTGISMVNYDQAVERILLWAQHQKSRYVCVANVHMLMEAHDSAAYRQIVNSADLVTPDGMPLVWVMRLKGERNQQRVYGPALMMHVLEMACRENISVGFYGSSPEVLRALLTRIKAQFPQLNITYSFSPSFQKISREENLEAIQRINASSTRILFVGLGCPKQEKWMAEQRGRINAVMIGVGAAFDFHAGLKPQAPSWMQMAGMEWFHRLATEPRRLWRRYLYHNPRFILLALQDLLNHSINNKK
jgi:N-acetylglucosaminyldiphosphoundecaprenol N-acetyl-beta-D-mannosaminyltransferase